MNTSEELSSWNRERESGTHMPVDNVELVGGNLSPATIAALARELYTDGPLFTRILQHWRPFICPFDQVIEEIPRGSFVLDVGCGGGLLLGALAQLGRIRGGIGFDYSRSAIAVAQAMTSALPSDHGVRFQHLSIDEQWPQGKFDAVLLIDVLHHVSPHLQRDVFQRAAQAVSGGARLVYKDIGARPRWRAFANTVHDLVMAQQLVHYVPTSVVIQWAEAEGLAVAHAFALNRLWYGHQFVTFVRAG